MANTKNLGIRDTLNATDIRFTKKGQYTVIQFSLDGGKNYQNLEEADGFVNILATAFGDIDGDGTDDNVLTSLDNIKEKIKSLEEQSLPSEDLNNLKKQIASIEEKVKQNTEEIEKSIKITPVPDEFIYSLFDDED